MSSALQDQTYLYRLVSVSDWCAAKQSGKIDYTQIDKTDGYFHLSFIDQMLETASRYFSGSNDLLCLEIRFVDVAEKIRVEPVAGRGGEAFPHLYGILEFRLVKRVFWMLEDDKGKFNCGEDYS